MSFASNYYSNKGEHNYRDFFSSYEVNEKEETLLKNKINQLQKDLDTELVKYKELISNRYSSELTPIKQKTIINYHNKGGISYLFDFETGQVLSNELLNDENHIIVNVNLKIGQFSTVIGYIYKLGGVLIRVYNYTINKDNTMLKKFIVQETIIPIVGVNDSSITSCKGVIYDKGTISHLTSDSTKLLALYNAKDFVENFYDISLNGCDINLAELINAYRDNASLETLLKQNKGTSIKKLLDFGTSEGNNHIFKPTIAQYLGLTKPEYQQLLKADLVIDYIDFLRWTCQFKDGTSKAWEELKCSKTTPEWINYLQKCKAWEEDFNFYNIDYSGHISCTLVKGYLGIPSYYYYKLDSLISSLYSFGDYCSYVIEGCINQGYTQLSYFISDLHDYISMTKHLNIKPILTSSYLKQTHDITSRNYKVQINAEQEQLFKERYNNYIPWKSSDNKFTLIAPKNSDEVKNEGSQMNNCVASYIKRILDGNCQIFFFRRTNEPDTSYMTVEIKDNALVQVKRSHNRTPDSTDVKYLKEMCTLKNWKYLA